MNLIDTNVFLEVMLRRENHAPCKHFLQGVRDGKYTSIVTDFSLHTIFVTMNRSGKKQRIRRFLIPLLHYEGLDIVRTHTVEEAQAVTVSEKQGLDLEDALLYHKAQKENVDTIISLDSDFDGLEIPRKTPEETLN